MTYLQLVKGLLNTQWEVSAVERELDVPKPILITENEEAKQSLKTNDYAEIKDGGDTTYTPQGIGWTHESVEAVVSVDIRCADRRVNGIKQDGRTRIFGYRNMSTTVDEYGLSPFEPERYGGLTGETKRICDKFRKGIGEFDLVAGTTIRDLSNESPENHYRAVVDIGLTSVANQITPAAGDPFDDELDDALDS